MSRGGGRMFVLTKENLDKRICDVEGSANEETFRTFIMDSEEEFGMGVKQSQEI
jgi:hypothetical protein